MSSISVSARPSAAYATGAPNAVVACWLQFITELKLRSRGINFRSDDETEVLNAYGRMTEEEFQLINARQAWCSWRTITAALRNWQPLLPVLALDLGCGIGESTRVLAAKCPIDSQIIGYEFSPQLHAAAARRQYANAIGGQARVSFVCQGIGKTLLDPFGRQLASGSVSLASATGVIGHHLTPESFKPLAFELQRLLTHDGIALLDVGPTMSEGALTKAMAAAGFIPVARFRSWLLDPCGQVLFTRPT